MAQNRHFLKPTSVSVHGHKWKYEKAWPTAGSWAPLDESALAVHGVEMAALRDIADVPSLPTSVRFGYHCLGCKAAKSLPSPQIGGMDCCKKDKPNWRGDRGSARGRRWAVQRVNFRRKQRFGRFRTGLWAMFSGFLSASDLLFNRWFISFPQRHAFRVKRDGCSLPRR